MIILEYPVGLNSSQTICLTFQNYYVNFQTNYFIISLFILIILNLIMVS